MPSASGQLAGPRREFTASEVHTRPCARARTSHNLQPPTLLPFLTPWVADRPINSGTNCPAAIAASLDRAAAWCPSAMAGGPFHYYLWGKDPAAPSPRHPTIVDTSRAWPRPSRLLTGVRSHAARGQDDRRPDLRLLGVARRPPTGLKVLRHSTHPTLTHARNVAATFSPPPPSRAPVPFHLPLRAHRTACPVANATNSCL
jgi:hypothetical protein